MVELYYLNVAAITPRQYKRLCKSLSEYRVNKANAYARKEDKLLSIGAGYLLDTALKRRGLSEREASYAFNEYGKPYIGGINFNLSHSGSVAVCALSVGDVGVDVQKLVSYDARLAEKICTPSELAQIKTGEDLTRLWVAKESYVKYLGTGFSTSFTGLETDLAAPLCIREGGKTANVIFTEFDLQGYRLAVCAAQPSSPPERVELSLT